MIFYFFITYFLKVNKTNYNTIINQSYKIPTFLLIFSPHCPHCTAVHPSWEELMSKYANDAKVIIAECNAIEYRQECKSLFKYTGYPTFIEISRGHAKEINPKRKIEVFINETERLKKIDFSIPCSTFQTEFDQNYPAFILSSQKSALEKCNQLQKIIEIYPQAKNHLYLNSTESVKESFAAITSQGNHILYNGKSEAQSLIDFMQDLLMVPFGDWNYSDASLLNKRIGLLIHSNHGQYLSFSKIISSYSDIFSLCKIDTGRFSEIFPEYKRAPNSPPSFAISNKEKTKFFILENVLSDQQFQVNLKKSVEGQFDRIAKYDLSALFPIRKDSKNRKIFNQNEKLQNNAKDKKKEAKEQIEIQKANENNDEIKNHEYKNPIQYNDKINTKSMPKSKSISLKTFVTVAIFATFSVLFGIIYFMKDETEKIE